MPASEDRSQVNRVDYWIALGLGLFALLCYIRTLAPDVLYGDSAEFQALSYTLGIAHSTGYPVYLLLGKVLGTLLPFGTFAYRINLLSAIYAAFTLVGMCLLARFLTRSRFAAVAGCIALGSSQSFWSQAVIAEVYTLATLVLTWSIYCLWRWQSDPAKTSGWLFTAVLLLGLGIHTMAVLAAPAVGVFILWTLWALRSSRSTWKKAVISALAGGIAGAAVFLLVFYVFDSIINTPTSFLNTSLIPSRTLWGASLADFDSYFKRLYHTVISLQWGRNLLFGNLDYMVSELGKFGQALAARDFSILVTGFGLLGAAVLWTQHKRHAGFLLLGLFSLLFYIINYNVGNKFVYYLATYIFIMPLMSVGAGFVLNKAVSVMEGWEKSRARLAGKVLVLILVGLIFTAPAAESRFQALLAGKAVFYTDDEYTFPVADLMEPRFYAESVLSSTPPGSVLLIDWRKLYAVVYLAQVERARQDITFYEACPYPCDGVLPDSLVQTITAALQAGRPVFVDQVYKNSEENSSHLTV